MAHVAAIAREPRITGSPQLAAARGYLLQQLEALGLEAQVQEAVGAHRDGNRLLAGSVQNIVGRIAGREEGKALMLTAHYDSVPTGPGASDDAAGVATLLETARALKAGSEPKNDIVFLFTDAEEPCLCGARAFVESHPWAQDVGLVLNFEARGNRGPAMMFETVGANGWMTGHLRDGGRQVVASSVASFFYNLSSSDTDLTVFRTAGMPGMNFAYLTGLPHYHTRIDTLGRIDRRSLQHLGAYALPLARHLGNSDLTDTAGGDNVYFSVLGRLIAYPQNWRFGALALALASGASVILVGFRRRMLRRSKIAWGLLFFPLTAVIASASVIGIWTLIRALHPAGDPIVFEYQAWMFWVGIATLTLAIALAGYLRFRRKLEVAEVAAGSLVWWLVLATAAAFAFPPASYLFAWPAISLSLALALWVAHPRSWTYPQLFVALMFAGLPALLVFAPAVFGVTLALGLFLVFVFPLVVVLLITLVIPHLAHLVERFPRGLPLGALGVGVAMLLSGALLSRFDASNPRVTGVFYILNADTDEAIWATEEDSPSQWTSRFLGSNPKTLPPGSILPEPDVDPLLQAPAPPADLPEPEVSFVNETMLGDERQLTLALRTPPDTYRLTISVDENTEIVALAVGGQAVPVGVLGDAGRTQLLDYAAPPEEGLTLTLTTKNDRPVAVTARVGFPGLAGISSLKRPAATMPGQTQRFVDDWRYVVRSFELPPGQPVPPEGP